MSVHGSNRYRLRVMPHFRGFGRKRTFMPKRIGQGVQIAARTYRTDFGAITSDRDLAEVVVIEALLGAAAEKRSIFHRRQGHNVF